MKYFIAHINQPNEWIEERVCNRESLKPHILALFEEKKEGAEVAFFPTKLEAIEACIKSINRRVNVLYLQIEQANSAMDKMKKEI